MEGYSVKIAASTKDLTAREKISLKDTTLAISLDEATMSEDVIIDYDYHVILNVHNEKSDNKDYTKTVVVAKYGTRFITGSASFTDSLTDIVDEMIDAGEGDNIVIKVYRIESKNYKGKQFITCSLI